MVPIHTAQALTLQEALAEAYQSNPELLAARQALRAANEEYPQAISAWLPSVSLSSAGSKTFTKTDSGTISKTTVEAFNNSITWSQSFYKGGQNFAALDRARSNIENQRVTLATSEQTVLLAGITAYMNVIRDSAIRRLRQTNVDLLTKRLETTQVQFDLGQKTQTDLSQAKSRLARAKADLTTAIGTLNTAEANFKRLIGLDPKDLDFPPPVADLPKKLDEAVKRAIRDNLTVQAARHQIDIAQADIDAAQGVRLPSLEMSSSYSHNKSFTHGPDSDDSQESSLATTLTLTVPIYQNGSELSKVRAAKKTMLQRRLLLDDARLKAKESMIQAWGNLLSARARTESYGQEVEAAKAARANVEKELEIGRRTVLDYLDAQKEVLDAEVNRVTARRDVIVLSYTVITGLGRLNAEFLKLPVDLYDPNFDFERQKFNFFGTSID